MLKASGSYTEIYLEQKRILASKLLRELEALLNPYTFYRSHNSYIINLAKIEKIQNEDGCFVVFKNGMRAEVSKKNKEELHQR
jgi:two-component system LytT family response regulator